jgi:hypothetical protein
LYSPVLKAALNSRFIEGQTQTYALDDTTDEVFRLLVQWFYGQKLESPVTDAEVDSVGRLVAEDDWINPTISRFMKISHQHQTSLVGLWILADKLCIPALQNLVVDELELIRKSWPTGLIAYHVFQDVYKHTLPGMEISDNKLRYLLLTHVLYQSAGFEVRIYRSQFPHEMLIDYIFLSKTMDRTLLQEIFSKEDLFRSTFHVSEEDFEDMKKV